MKNSKKKFKNIFSYHLRVANLVCTQETIILKIILFDYQTIIMFKIFLIFKSLEN